MKYHFDKSLCSQDYIAFAFNKDTGEVPNGLSVMDSPSFPSLKKAISYLEQFRDKALNENLVLVVCQHQVHSSFYHCDI